MTSRSTVENKISATRKYLKILAAFKKYSKKTLSHDIIIRGSLERYLYLVIQSCIDLAEAVITYKHLRKPTSLSETFDILQEERILPLKLTEKLVQMTGFRNIIAHNYEIIDYDIVYRILHKDLADIKQYIKKIESIHL